MSTDSATIQFSSPGSKEMIEEGLAFAPKFDEKGLIAAMAIDWKTNEPLMLAYMNEESLRMTLQLKKAVYWSRSREKLWLKGETSGEVQFVKEIYVDCDQDALVLKVEQQGGGCCHTKRPTCFYRKVELDKVGGGPVTLAKS
jgi:phosphoribosyl-AMP cyclohydrolase